MSQNNYDLSINILNLRVTVYTLLLKLLFFIIVWSGFEFNFAGSQSKFSHNLRSTLSTDCFTYQGSLSSLCLFLGNFQIISQ